MAIIFPRKLLSPTNNNNNNTINNNNETTSFPCPKFCDPTCDNFDDCFVVPASGFPLPPLPPPLPPISVVVSGDTATNNTGVQISPLVIIVVIVLASLFLLITYYTVVIKYCTFWSRVPNGRDRDQSPRPDTGRGDAGRGDGQTADSLIHENEDIDPVIDHPIWLISTVGLHQSVINAITMLRYKKGDGLIDGTDCSVCLSEFQEGETLRLLPKCKHAFHIDCIDTWLRSHTNCPLCRAGIVANSGRASLGTNEASFGHSRRVEFSPTVDSNSSDVELGRNQLRNNSGEVVEHRDVIVNSDNNNNNNNNSNNNTNNNNSVDLNDQSKGGVDFNSIVRRSFSMDFFRGSNFQRNDSNSSSTQVMDSSSSSRPQPLRQPPMKRSYSWGERVFWSSRNQSNGHRGVSP